MNSNNFCPTGKVIYDKKSATTLRNLTEKTHHVKMNIYECKTCNYWHLTTIGEHRTFRHAKDLTSKRKRSKLKGYLKG